MGAKETSPFTPKNKDIQNDLLIHVYVTHIESGATYFHKKFSGFLWRFHIAIFLVMSFALCIMVS